MRCVLCTHNNPPRVQFCQKCGKKMEMTAEEVQKELYLKRQKEIEQETEFYSRQFLVFGIIAFLLSMILWMSSGSAPSATVVPSAARNSEYGRIDYVPTPAVEKLWVPYESKF